MVSRRNALRALSLAASASYHDARSQAPGRSYRVGWVSASDAFKEEPYNQAFVQRLAELGFIEGRNLVIERRHYETKLEKIAALSAELGKLKCDAFFGGGGEASLAALTQANRQTPIVFVAVDFDPIATGDVLSLARPGGRVTGVSAIQSELPAKRIELFKELLPAMRKLAVFTNEQTVTQLTLVQGTARRLGLELHIVDFKRPPFNYEAGFADATRAGADALLVLGSGLWVPGRRLICELALKARLPTAFHQAQWVGTGGLMSYGFDFPKMWRRGAEMVAKVLNGAKVNDIPMEQPTVFELAFNKTTAKVLDIKIPHALLLRADRIIE